MSGWRPSRPGSQDCPRGSGDRRWRTRSRASSGASRDHGGLADARSVHGGRVLQGVRHHSGGPRGHPGDRLCVHGQVASPRGLHVHQGRVDVGLGRVVRGAWLRCLSEVRLHLWGDLGMTHAEEVLRRTRERVEAEVRALPDSELEAAFRMARPWRQSLILEEHRRREARPELQVPQVRSVWWWLRHPVL